NPKSVTDIQTKYTDEIATTTKVRVLIVPGHEPDYGGAEFGTTKERELTVMLADDLNGFLQDNSHYTPIETRSYHAWNPEFQSYFTNSWNDIIAWEKASMRENAQLISVGTVKKPISKVYHNKAPLDVAHRLFGITKWANEHDIDITVHIHFNDSPDHTGSGAGTHSGFAIYVPVEQYANSTTTKAVAESIYKRLRKYNPVSDLPGESTGIVEEPDLIAIGADNTANSASLLIEYGYIYEKQFTDPVIRDMAIRDLAYQTYLGIEDFFGGHADLFSSGYDTLMVPHEWKSIMGKNKGSADEVFALQTALLLDGTYPPQDKSKNECPRSGSFGPCTQTALRSFQKKYDISGEQGVVGPQTVEVLNKLYSVKLF
ncbi:MAG: N-acetylmuramoyl-L-alanine amidase, partial [Candidatus Taylorbacteria bacterium]